MANIFISHRTADLLEAEKLAEELKTHGFNVWFDKWEIGLGDSITGKMQEGLSGADFLILCYSTAGVMAPWMSREWLSALARQLNGIGIKILPVVLAGGQPPAILADLKYIDLSVDWDGGILSLIDSINHPH